MDVSTCCFSLWSTRSKQKTAYASWWSMSMEERYVCVCICVLCLSFHPGWQTVYFCSDAVTNVYVLTVRLCWATHVNLLSGKVKCKIISCDAFTVRRDFLLSVEKFNKQQNYHPILLTANKYILVSKHWYADHMFVLVFLNNNNNNSCFMQICFAI